MRSSVPIPGNLWPHDMTITIEDDSNALLELLWIREAWNPHPVGDGLPPLLSDSSVSVQAESDSPVELLQWQDAWPALWLLRIDTGRGLRPTSTRASAVVRKPVRKSPSECHSPR